MEGIVLSFIFYNVIVWLIYRHYKRNDYEVSNSQLLFYTILFIGFATYGNHLGDYWRINEMVEIFGRTSVLDIGRSMEAQYYLLAKFVNGDFVLWRLIISCITFLGLAFFLRKSGMANYPTLMLFAATSLFWSAGHRGYWGQIYYYFSVFLYFRSKNPLYLLFAAFSYFSHSSTILLLALFPLTFFKFNRYAAFAFIMFLSLGIEVFQENFNNVAENGMGNEYYSQKIEAYSSQNLNNYFGASIGEYLQNFFSMVPKYLFMFYLLRLVLFNKTYTNNLKPELNAVINVSVVLFMVSIVASFMNLGSGTIAVRIFALSSFPILLLWQYILVGKYEKYKTKLVKWLLISTELTYIFSIYYAHIHGINY